MDSLGPPSIRMRDAGIAKSFQGDRTWVVYRAVKDKRCTGGERWVALGWVTQASEEQARLEARKVFNRFDQEQLRLMPCTRGFGWFV